MIQIIVVTASVLLGLLLYTPLMNIYRSFVTGLYKSLNVESSEKEVKPTPQNDKYSSIIGEVKTLVGQSRTKAATNLETEKGIEKEPIFAQSENSDPEIKDAAVALEKMKNLAEEEFDADNERVELETGYDATCASGVSFEELGTVKEVIPKEEPKEDEAQEAGRILYQNRKTDMFEQVASSSNKNLEKVNSLIHIYMVKHNKEKPNAEDQQSKDDISAYENFDPSSFFN